MADLWAIRRAGTAGDHDRRVFGVEPEHFPTLGNLTNILSQLTIGAIVAMGLTVPLVAGEFDLSLGFQTSLLCVLAAGLSNKFHAHPLAILPIAPAGGRRPSAR